MGNNKNTFAKRQKELARKRKAAEKRERRWAKKEQSGAPEELENFRVLTEAESLEALAAKREKEKAKSSEADPAKGK